MKFPRVIKSRSGVLVAALAVKRRRGCTSWFVAPDNISQNPIQIMTDFFMSCGKYKIINYKLIVLDQGPSQQSIDYSMCERFHY